MYSASHDDAVMVFCLRADYEIKPDPRLQAYPPMLRLVSRQLAQSESVNPTRFIVLPFPPNVSFRSCVPFKYQTSRIAAFQ